MHTVYSINNFICFICSQNFLNESLKYIDKTYPTNGHIAGGGHSGNTTSASTNAGSSVADTKPIHLDTKVLLQQHNSKKQAAVAAAEAAAAVAAS